VKVGCPVPFLIGASAVAWLIFSFYVSLFLAVGKQNKL